MCLACINAAQSGQASPSLEPAWPDMRRPAPRGRSRLDGAFTCTPAEPGPHPQERGPGGDESDGWRWSDGQ